MTPELNVSVVVWREWRRVTRVCSSEGCLGLRCGGMPQLRDDGNAHAGMQLSACILSSTALSASCCHAARTVRPYAGRFPWRPSSVFPSLRVTRRVCTGQVPRRCPPPAARPLFSVVSTLRPLAFARSRTHITSPTLQHMHQIPGSHPRIRFPLASGLVRTWVWLAYLQSQGPKHASKQEPRNRSECAQQLSSSAGRWRFLD